MIFEHSEVLIMQPKTDICEKTALNIIASSAFRIVWQGWEGREGEWIHSAPVLLNKTGPGCFFVQRPSGTKWLVPIHINLLPPPQPPNGVAVLKLPTEIGNAQELRHRLESAGGCKLTVCQEACC